MRNGMKPNVTIFKDGICNAVLLGYDMVTEHEWGLDGMKQIFCSGFSSFEDMVEAYRKDKSIPTADQVLRMIDQNLNRIVFRENKEEQAFMFTTVPGYRIDRANEYLDEDFARLIKEGKAKRDRKARGEPIWGTYADNANYQSAWDKNGFRMFGLGTKEFKRLGDFYKALSTGKCLIGASNYPMFRDLKNVGGLAIVDKTKLAFEDTKAVIENSAALLEKVILYANGKQEELMELANQLDNGHSYIWPVRKGDKIVYNINPGHAVKANYLGGYTEAQVRRWCAHKCNYQLTPESPE